MSDVTVQVGDVVKVRQDAEIPADLVFLSSADPDSLCYVETANLDGETNLKLKYCYSRTAKAASVEELEAALDVRFIECEIPNERLYQVRSKQYPSMVPDRIWV